MQCEVCVNNDVAMVKELARGIEDLEVDQIYSVKSRLPLLHIFHTGTCLNCVLHLSGWDQKHKIKSIEQKMTFFVPQTYWSF